MNDPVVTEAFDVLLELCQRGAVGPIEEGLRQIVRDASALRTLKICLEQVDHDEEEWYRVKWLRGEKVGTKVCRTCNPRPSLGGEAIA